MTDNIRINGQRLWASIMEMAKIGALSKGGCRRLTLSDEDKVGRDLFIEWCEAAGCTISIDRLGNTFARRAGRDDSRLPVGAGSHLDTQPHGGKFDGVFGVLSALEVVRTLNDHSIETTAPIEIVNWTNEEGARFAPSMMASGVFAGVFDLETILNVTDTDGKRFGDELERIGYAGDLPVGNHPFAAFFEAHIEQGPILEATETPVGVVTDVQGFRWYDLTLTGQDAHSGSTPMESRRDALLGTARIIEAVNKAALAYAPDGRGTVGFVKVVPNSRNTIPGQVELTIDYRHPSHDVLTEVDAMIRADCKQIAADIGLELDLRENSYSPPVKFDERCVDAVQSAAEMLGYKYRRMISGAGHDACYVSTVSPTSMIFAPCANGISHSESESAEPDDLEAGANVLLHAMLKMSL